MCHQDLLFGLVIVDMMYLLYSILLLSVVVSSVDVMVCVIVRVYEFGRRVHK